MSQREPFLDKKSLRSVNGKTADWNELSMDCAVFANAMGERLLLGIDDGQDQPYLAQGITTDLPDSVRRKLAGQGKPPVDDEILRFAELILEDVGR